jgi:hypothetical protein
MTGLSDDDLGRLGAFEQLNSGVLNELVCRSLRVLRTELARVQIQNKLPQNEVGRQQTAVRDLRTQVDWQ